MPEEFAVKDKNSGTILYIGTYEKCLEMIKDNSLEDCIIIPV